MKNKDFGEHDQFFETVHFVVPKGHIPVVLGCKGLELRREIWAEDNDLGVSGKNMAM